jgi:predicted P-loop ATPase
VDRALLASIHTTSLAELERQHGPLPETLRAATGGDGHHYYFAIAHGAAVRGGVLADGLDVKADGGYVIAPPSTHPNGKSYRWETDPRTVRIAPCPEWVLAVSKGDGRIEPRERGRDASQSPLGRAFADAGMLGRSLDGGKRAVVCPWQKEHTTGTPFDSSTVLFPASAPNGIGGFLCSHSHCAERKAADALRELRRRAAGELADRSWMLGLRRTEKGELKASFANVVQILTHDTEYAGKFRQDEMRGVVSLDGHELTDAAVSKIRVDLELRYGIQPTDPETARAVQLVSSQNAFHPVREFLASLSWDGTARLERVATDFLRIRAECEEEVAIASLLVMRWLVGLVARPFEPGCKLDTALILQGAQGAGKSTFFRVIGGEWFSDTEMALDKDALMQLRGAWIYEWAELENVMGRHTVARVKAFLTSTEDKYRPPFGRNPVTVKRSGVIVGTTNNEDFLHDPTGRRRFWVVPVGRVDVERVRAEREQLLAEAVAAWRRGERRWLTEEEEMKRESLAQRFVETDPWEERVLEFAERQDKVRTSDVLLQGLDIPIDKLSRRDEMRVANILRRSGYEPRQMRWVRRGLLPSSTRSTRRRSRRISSTFGTSTRSFARSAT